jgi:hypothetical protein
LLQVPISSVDSLSDLNKFMSVFGEGIAVLTALKVPDLGDFILFSLASRCHSSSCRTLFESETTRDFPTVDDLFTFIKNRIAILERVQGVAGKQAVPASRLKYRPPAPSKWSRKVDRPSLTSLVSAVQAPVSSPHTLLCQCCNNSHALDVCRKFSSLSVDERMKWRVLNVFVFRVSVLGIGHLVVRHPPNVPFVHAVIIVCYIRRLTTSCRHRKWNHLPSPHHYYPGLDLRQSCLAPGWYIYAIVLEVFKWPAR